MNPLLNNPRVDRLFYDLKYGVDLLDEFISTEDEQYQIGNTVPVYLQLDATGNPVRLDTCQVPFLSPGSR